MQNRHYSLKLSGTEVSMKRFNAHIGFIFMKMAHCSEKFYFRYLPAILLLSLLPYLVMLVTYFLKNFLEILRTMFCKDQQNQWRLVQNSQGITILNRSGLSMCVLYQKIWMGLSLSLNATFQAGLYKTVQFGVSN